MKRLMVIAGARPNFIKCAPLCWALDARGIPYDLVHTGQHYDAHMSDIFFRELAIPTPQIHLGVGMGDRLTQMQKISVSLLPYLQTQKPAMTVVVGDVTSTVAGAMTSLVAGIPVAHIEAGLRSFNWRMPEEINRVTTDHCSSVLFATEQSGVEHLLREGKDASSIHLVGNIMIDTLKAMNERADASTLLAEQGITPRGYGVITLHRPENVDDPSVLRDLIVVFAEAGKRVPLVWPMHPRTQARLEAAGIPLPEGVRVIEPLGYLEMLALTKHARLVMTDSGGLQEETTVLGIPCLTLREETERLVTVSEGTSELVGRDAGKILAAVDRVLSDAWKTGRIPDLWDGKTAERIVDHLSRIVV